MAAGRLPVQYPARREERAPPWPTRASNPVMVRGATTARSPRRRRCPPTLIVGHLGQAQQPPGRQSPRVADTQPFERSPGPQAIITMTNEINRESSRARVGSRESRRPESLVDRDRWQPDGWAGSSDQGALSSSLSVSSVQRRKCPITASREHRPTTNQSTLLSVQPPDTAGDLTAMREYTRLPPHPGPNDRNAPLDRGEILRSPGRLCRSRQWLTDT